MMEFDKTNHAKAGIMIPSTEIHREMRKDGIKYE